MPTYLDDATTYLKRYSAYLVRLWQDTPDGSWRASAQSVQSGAVLRFGSLQALFAYLAAQTSDAVDSEVDEFKGDA